MSHPWRAWFVGDSVISSADMDPDDLPRDRLLGVVEYLPFDTPKRYQHTGENWYFWWQSPDGLVIGSNSDSLEENQRRYPGAVFVRGKWTSHQEMQRVRDEMQAAHEAP